MKKKSPLSKTEVAFLKSRDLGRLATASKDGEPHVVPVIYALDKDAPVIAIDYGTKKLKNLKENKQVAFLVDDYNPNGGILISGTAQLFERGREYKTLLKILFAKFEYYRNNPWKEGESPIVKVVPKKVARWAIPNVKEKGK